MKLFKRICLSKAIIFVLSITFLSGINPAFAQDEISDENTGEIESVIDEETVSEETEEDVGLRKGAYWWQEPDPNAIAGFVDFGVDIVAFRLGKIGVGQSSDDRGNTINVPVWESSVNFNTLDSLPTSLKYRPVVVANREVWTDVAPSDFAAWISTEVIEKFGELPVDSLEIKVSEETIPDYSILGDYFGELGSIAGDLEIFAGIPAIVLDTRASILIDSVDGFVVYFNDYDYTGLIPRITDNAWISTTSSILQNLGVTFTVVLPIYNQAVYMPADGNDWTRLPAVDVALISASSDAIDMGAAGIEFVLTEPVSVGNVELGINDKLRILSSTEEINIRELHDSLPELAPGIREIDLFRFPLVPGFDPPSQVAVEKAGWISGRLIGGGMTADQAVKEELDQKHNQTQQIIMIITVGMMMVILMRMFSKGGAGKKEGS